MKPCNCCAQRERHVYIFSCQCCEARHIARLIKPARLDAYRRAAARGEDVEALKARVKAEWDLDQQGEAA